MVEPESDESLVSLGVVFTNLTEEESKQVYRIVLEVARIHGVKVKIETRETDILEQEDTFVNIPEIEKALGITLYDDQCKYITGNTTIPNYDDFRGTGKTTAYCIKLALSSGPPLDLRNPTEFSDAMYCGLTGSNARGYSERFFLRKFTSIRDQLSNHGFPVREVKILKR